MMLFFKFICLFIYCLLLCVFVLKTTYRKIYARKHHRRFPFCKIINREQFVGGIVIAFWLHFIVAFRAYLTWLHELHGQYSISIMIERNISLLYCKLLYMSYVITMHVVKHVQKQDKMLHVTHVAIGCKLKCIKMKNEYNIIFIFLTFFIYIFIFRYNIFRILF